MGYNAEPVRNLIQKDEVLVYDYNRLPGNNFQVYYQEQRPDFVVPQTIANSDGTPAVLGSPAAGLTNEQNWSLYGIAIAGAVAPCTQTRPEVSGLVCDLSGTWTSPFPVSMPPGAPVNAQIVSPPPQ